MKLVPGFGPPHAPLVLLGEAPGTNEVLYGEPFIGEAGDELTRMLAASGIDRKAAYVTNVFKLQPPNNDVKFFFTRRAAEDACIDLPARDGKYLRAEFREMVAATLDELVGVGPVLVIALGATALWALFGFSKISAYVGTLHPPGDDRPYHVIPTYHPAAVLRQWSYRPIVLANFAKARDFLEAESRRRSAAAPAAPQFNLKVSPTLAEVRAFAKRAARAPEIAVDIETAHGQIRTISFCFSIRSAFCIPFWEPPASRYWPDLRSELEAWNCVREILAGPGTKIFHNGAYDIQYLWRGMGIPIGGDIEDTMLAHHALEPELPKGLGALAATYLKIPEWKTSRQMSEKDEE